jgi:hypothetical protein
LSLFCKQPLYGGDGGLYGLPVFLVLVDLDRDEIVCNLL